MRPSNKLIILFGLALATASSVFAEDTGYFRASAVDVFPKDDSLGDQVGFLISAGYEQNIPNSDNSLQFEVEVGNAKWSESIVSGATLVNVDYTYVPVWMTSRYQWKFNRRLSLAAGLSIGVIYARLDVGGLSDTDCVLSYGAGVQLNYRFSDVISATVGYRYLLNQDATFFGVLKQDMGAQMLELGLRLDWPY